MTVPAVRRLLREAGWAPLAIVVLNVLIALSAQPASMWWMLHLLAGAALAYFFLAACRIAGERTGSPGRIACYLLAFALTCTAALVWEIGEFAFDQMTGSVLQEGLVDTMQDLIFGVAGAVLGLGGCALLR